MVRRVALVLSEEPARIQAQEHVLARQGYLILVTDKVEVLATWTARVHVDIVIADAAIHEGCLASFLMLRQDAARLRDIPTLVLGALSAAESRTIADDPSVTVHPEALDVDAFGAILAEVLPLCA